MDNAFKYIITNKGIDSEDDYPYKGEHAHRVSMLVSLILSHSLTEHAHRVSVLVFRIPPLAHSTNMSIVCAYKGMDYNCSTGRANRTVATIDSFVDVPASSEAQLVAAVGTLGPVSVAIEADQVLSAVAFWSFNAFIGTRTCSLASRAIRVASLTVRAALSLIMAFSSSGTLTRRM